MKALFLAACLLACAAAQQADFTVVALPDTQKYSASYPQIFNAQTQWIKDHLASDNIQLVIGLGDIVNGGGDLTQWQNADNAIKIIDGYVPFVLAAGNHDYDKGDLAPLRRFAGNFNKYFGPARYSGKSYYAGNFRGSNENFYAVVNLGGKDTLILVLEFMPRDAALNWAKKILQANLDKEAWIVTHAFGYRNDQISTCDAWTKESFGVTGNDGQQVWRVLGSQYANISLILSGHVTAHNGVGRRQDYGASGKLVNQILSDYQAYVNGGNGYLRIMRFHPSQNTIDVQTYSPYADAWLTDAANQFTVQYREQDPGGSGAIKGQITDNTQCNQLAGVTVSDDQGHSTVSDPYGNYTLSGVNSGKITITAKKSGFTSQSKTLNVGSKAATLKFSLQIN